MAHTTRNASRTLSGATADYLSAADHLSDQLSDQLPDVAPGRELRKAWGETSA